MNAESQMVLRPLDIPVALRFAECPGAPYRQIADDLGMSSATVHESVSRLEQAQLLRPGERAVNRHALLEFLEHGVRYAFPASPSGRRGRGVPTAHSAPPLDAEIDGSVAWVWPSPRGEVEGQVITPLFKQAWELPQRCPSVYELLALLDSVRAGRARERKIAVDTLRDRLGYRRKGDAA
jgi:DNA-binding Lrp family transcriptional regulator